MCLQKNSILLSGEVTVPELRGQVCYFYLSQKDKSNKVSSFLVKVSNKELVEYLTKNITQPTSLLVFGSLLTEKYDTPQGKQSFSSVSVREVYPSVPGVYINKAEFSGRLTKNADFFAATETKKALGRMSLATTRVVGEQEETEFVDITLFDKKAEFVNKYMSKGTAATVTGKLVLEQYTSKTGEQKVAYRVTCSTVNFTGDKGGGSVSAQLPPTGNVATPPQQGVPGVPNGTAAPNGAMPTADGTVPGMVPMGWGNFPPLG